MRQPHLSLVGRRCPCIVVRTSYRCVRAHLVCSTLPTRRPLCVVRAFLTTGTVALCVRDERLVLCGMAVFDGQPIML